MGPPWLGCLGFFLWWLLLFQSTDSRACRLQQMWQEDAFWVSFYLRVENFSHGANFKETVGKKVKLAYGDAHELCSFGVLMIRGFPGEKASQPWICISATRYPLIMSRLSSFVWHHHPQWDYLLSAELRDLGQPNCCWGYSYRLGPLCLHILSRVERAPICKRLANSTNSASLWINNGCWESSHPSLLADTNTNRVFISCTH